MSRQIDLTKPLSDEDRQYLEDRARHRDIEIADANAKGEEPPAAPLPADDLRSSTVRSPSAVPAAPAAREQAEAAQEPTERSADAEADNYDDEEAWSYDDIKDEVKGRDAEDKPALNSKREALIEWLREDDAR